MMFNRIVRFSLLGILVAASSAAAAAPTGVDPQSDSMGVYFDTAANVIDGPAVPFVPFPLYLLLVNPTAPVDGFECTVTLTGAPYYFLETDLGEGAIDVDPSANGFAVGVASPYPMSSAMRLVRWTFMVQSASPLSIYISEATTPSLPGGWPVVTGDGILRRCNLFSGYPAYPVACVNTICHGTPSETVSFGAVKSLYR